MNKPFIIDAHLDLSMNALEWNRDLRQPLKEINRREIGMTDKPDRGNATISFEELRKGNVGLVVATQIGRYVGPDNPLPGWHSPEQAWAQTQGQLAWYKAMEEEGQMVMIRDKKALDTHLALWKDGEPADKKPIGYVLSIESADRAVHLAARAQGDRFRIGIGVVDDEVRRVPAFGQAPGEQYLLVARRGGEIGDLVAGRSGFGDILTPACGEARGDERYQQKVDYLFHACSDLSGWLIETGILPENRRVVHDFDLVLRDREDQVVRIE